MSGILFIVIGLLIGSSIAVSSAVYLKKEWNDKESRKIYAVLFGVGLTITIGFIIKIVIFGL